MPFPAPPSHLPDKDEVGDYLERYAERFDLPVRTSVRVERLTRSGGRFVVRAGEATYEADSVVVATGAFQSIPPSGRGLQIPHRRFDSDRRLSVRPRRARTGPRRFWRFLHPPGARPAFGPARPERAAPLLPAARPGPYDPEAAPAVRRPRPREPIPAARESLMLATACSAR